MNLVPSFVVDNLTKVMNLVPSFVVDNLTKVMNLVPSFVVEHIFIIAALYSRDLGLGG
jgi:hypothetical protein